MTLLVALDSGMFEWKFDSPQIFFGFYEMTAGLAPVGQWAVAL